jgi:hydroxymethylpyrimidine pyrophosphatase-like HAD family hydrolase
MTDGTDAPRIAAVLADVDGTLVTKDKRLTPRAIRATRQMQENGVLFAITSGRPPRGMRMLVEPLGMHVPMAAFNGGVLIMPDLTIVDERPIPSDVAPAIIETIHGYALDTWIYHATEWYITNPDVPHGMREARTVSSHRPSYPTTTASSTEPSRSSASATTTTSLPAASKRCSSSSARRSRPRDRSGTTSTSPTRQPTRAS